MSDNIVRPDFDKEEKTAIELIYNLKEAGAPLNSVKFLKHLKTSLECIINGDISEDGEDDEDGISNFIIGFHDYTTDCQYIATFNDDDTVSVYTNIPVYNFIDEVELKDTKFMEVIFQSFKKDSVSSEYMTVFQDEVGVHFAFIDFIKKLEEVVQRIINIIPPILLNN